MLKRPLINKGANHQNFSTTFKYKRVIMTNKCIKLLFLCCIVFPYISQAQEQGTESTEFYLTYLENLDLLFNGDPQFSLYVDAQIEGNLQIEFPATGLTYQYEYQAAGVTEIILPDALYYSENSEIITNKGLKISTTSPIELTAFHYRPFFSEATKVLASENLGSEYFTTCFLDFDKSLDSPSSFAIVATEGNTMVEITPTANTSEFRPKDVPFVITLDEGQTYEVQSPGDLTGSHVLALNGERLAVFSGALKANVACGPADSHMYDQQLPVDLLGREYAAIPFGTQVKGYFRVLSLKDNNMISISGDFIQTLEKSEFLDIELSEASIISSTEDCSVSQISYSYECSSPKMGDPNMLQLYPITYVNTRCLSTNSLGFNENFGGFTNRYITLVANSESQSSVTIDNESPQWFSINGGDYWYSIIDAEKETSIIEAPMGVQAYAYGFGDYDAYTYSLGFDRAITSNTTAIGHTTVDVYPNPAVNSLRINSENVINNITLQNQLGQELDYRPDINTQTTTIDISKLPTGALYLGIQTNEGFVTKKIIKI